jgi:hypothetical protein
MNQGQMPCMHHTSSCQSPLADAMHREDVHVVPPLDPQTKTWSSSWTQDEDVATYQEFAIPDSSNPMARLGTRWAHCTWPEVRQSAVR